MSAVHPNYKWADTGDTVWVTMEIPYVKKEDVKLELNPDGKVSLKTAEVKGKNYSMKLELFGRIRVEDSSWQVKNDRYVVVQLKKLDTEENWRTLQKPHIKKPPYERVDWDRAKIEVSDDSDEEEVDTRSTRLVDPDANRFKSLKKVQPENQFIDGLDALLFFVVIIYIWVCPYTKVEESFNLQATHDILYHRFNLSAYPLLFLWQLYFIRGRYDHHMFPGVVPRSFLGPLLVAILSAPIAIPMYLIGLPKIAALVIVRGAIGLLTTTTFGLFRREIAKKFGEVAGIATAVITVCQFHLLFYISRPLPNVFALIFVLLALRFWLQEKYYHAIVTSVATAAIFRSEVGLLFGPVFIEALLKRRIQFGKTVVVGIAALAGAIALSVVVDSFFWKRLLWPEGEVFFFNTVENRSHEWGTSPFHWYFTNALPRALLGAIPLIFIGAYFERQRLSVYLRPALIFLVLYSFLPHKELRFIFPAIPLLNMAAGVGMARLYNNYSKFKFRIVFFACVAILAASLAASCGFLAVSYSNYPGGHAFAALHGKELLIVPPSMRPKDPYVHIDNLAAITGVSRFGEDERIRYSKQEGKVDYNQFTHLLSPVSDIPGFEVVHTEEGFSGISRSWPFIKTTPQIYAMRKKKVEIPKAEEDASEE